MALHETFNLLVISLIFIYLTNVVSAECNNGELYPNPVDCQLFHQCSNGVLYDFSCPEGLYFNPDLSVCDYPSNVNCPVPTSSTPSTTPAACTDFCGNYAGMLP